MCTEFLGGQGHESALKLVPGSCKNLTEALGTELKPSARAASVPNSPASSPATRQCSSSSVHANHSHL